MELDIKTKECVNMENEFNLEYEYEIIDNGVILSDPNFETKVACVSKNGDESEVKKLLGEWLVEDIKDVSNECTCNKLKISIKIEPIE